MITVAELVSAAKPLIGCSLTILWPSVLMMRQPPAAVPAAMVSAHSTLIQTAISKPLLGIVLDAQEVQPARQVIERPAGSPRPAPGR